MTQRGVTEAFPWLAGAWLLWHEEMLWMLQMLCCKTASQMQLNYNNKTQQILRRHATWQLVWLARQLANLPSCRVPTVTEMRRQRRPRLRLRRWQRLRLRLRRQSSARDEQQVKPPRDLFMQSDKI